jgi:U3 small nucleolar RNA-associated protein 25
VVFYAPPERANFYAEFMQYPFLRREVSGSSKNKPEAEVVEEVLEPSEVSGQVLFSKYDYLRLEKIVGSGDAKKMCSSDSGDRFSYV